MPTLRRFVPLPALLLAALACNLLAPTATPLPPAPTAAPSATLAPPATPTALFPGPTRPPAGTATPTAIAAATDAATQAPIPTRVATSSTGGLKLSAAGPWLLLSAANSLWALNADGSGLTQVLPPGPYVRLGHAAPSGGHAEFITSTDAAGIHNLTLAVLSLPGGEAQSVSPLTDATTEPGPDGQPGDANFDALRPLGQTDWSPDGASLAFIGAQAGPSADLFVYNLASQKVTRLTDGPSQAYGPSWSPDGRYIIQMGAFSFGTGAGYAMDGVWAARADNSGVKSLYKPEAGSGGEDLLGWAGPTTFAVDSFYVRCSRGRVRTFNIETGQTQSIFDGFYAQLAADPATGAALVAVNQATAGCDPGAQPGLYLARPGVKPLLLGPDLGNATQLGWSPPAGVFYASTDAGWLAFTPDGKPAHLPDAINGEPVVAPGGKTWAWLDLDAGGVQASLDGVHAQNVFSNAASLLTWSPDGQTLFFFSDGSLYAASLPDLKPVLVTDQLQLADYDAEEWVKK